MGVSRRHRRAMPATFVHHAISSWLALRIRLATDAQLGVLERLPTDAIADAWRDSCSL